MARILNHGYDDGKNYREADYIVINTCMVRESPKLCLWFANNLRKMKNEKIKNENYW
jgi:tRNA A37 methylthiotransferase MiaB